MARLDKNGGIKGSVGNLTYRQVGGQTILQSKPGKGNTNVHKNSLKSSDEFSLASNRARIMRSILSPVIRGYYDGKMINRFNNAVAKVIRSNEVLPVGHRDVSDGKLSLLNGFEFNQASLFSDYLKVEIEHEVTAAGLKLIIPAFIPLASMAFPFDASNGVMKVLVSALDLNNERFSYCCFRELMIPASNMLVPAVEWLLNENFPVEGLILVSVSLNYSESCLGEMVSLNRPQMNPCQLLCVFNATEVERSIAGNGNEMFGTWFPVAGRVTGPGKGQG